MAGVKMLRRIQFGTESTAGTAVAATTLLRAMGTIEDQRTTEFPEEHVGIIMGVDRSYVPKVLGQIDVEATPATFEQILYFLEAGIEANGSPVTDTGGSGRIWEYNLPTTTKATPQTFTIEGGDDQQAEEMAYCFATSFKLEGNAGEALMMSGTFQGREVAQSTFTGGVALPAIEDILFSKAKLYIDDVDGTAGTTQVQNTFVTMSLDHTTGFQPVFTADGELYFSFAKQTTPAMTIQVTFEHDAVGVAEKEAWRNQTPRLLQIRVDGSAFTTAGETYSNKALIIEVAGKWESFDPIGDTDNNDTLSGSFKVGYDPTYGAVGKVTVVNTLSSLP